MCREAQVAQKTRDHNNTTSSTLFNPSSVAFRCRGCFLPDLTTAHLKATKRDRVSLYIVLLRIPDPLNTLVFGPA